MWVDVAGPADFSDVRALLEMWKPGQRVTPRRPADLATGRSLFLLARLSNGAPVGLVEGHHDWTNWELLADWGHLTDADRGSYLLSLFVDPSVRSDQVGTALVDAFVAEAVGAGSPLVVVIPDAEPFSYERRLSFFRRCDFIPLAVTVPQPTWIWGRPLG
ncbi:hypothetical protein ASE38_05970 [Cellulomonas sp. Root930]|nr:hypothetical protein ASE38_05970 [Cellulomonas sp. Root930]